MEARGGTDERIVEVLMGFLDQFLRFPLSHARLQEERLERWKEDVIAHPRKLPNAQRDWVYEQHGFQSASTLTWQVTHPWARIR